MSNENEEKIIKLRRSQQIADLCPKLEPGDLVIVFKPKPFFSLFDQKKLTFFDRKNHCLLGMVVEKPLKGKFSNRNCFVLTLLCGENKIKCLYSTRQVLTRVFIKNHEGKHLGQRLHKKIKWALVWLGTEEEFKKHYKKAVKF